MFAFSFFEKLGADFEKICPDYLSFQRKSVFLQLKNFKPKRTMEAITFTPAQVHVFNLVSHIKSSLGLEHLRQQLAAFYAKQVDDEMDRLWENGQWDEKRMQELRGSHFRTPYKK